MRNAGVQDTYELLVRWAKDRTFAVDEQTVHAADDTGSVSFPGHVKQ